MKLIIVPVDSSNESANAVMYAAHLAKKIQKGIILINVYQIPISYSEVPLIEVSLKEIQDASKYMLDKYRTAIIDITNNKVEVNQLSIYGDTTSELIQYIQSNKTYLVIMGTKGVGGIERLFLGSTTMSLIRRIKTPILVVPMDTKYKKIKKIGLATDFHQVNETISVGFIKEWMTTFKATIDILHVDYERYHFDANTPMETMNMENKLEALNASYNYIEDKHVDVGIQRFCQQNHIDLLAVYPKEHTWFEQIFERSHTRMMIKQSNIPVLCLHFQN
jgi:nucleotide-binding universal stress UspA family protein